MAPRYDKNYTAHLPSYIYTSPTASANETSPSSPLLAVMDREKPALRQSYAEWGLHAVQIGFATYAAVWRAETFLFVASFILSLYEVRETHDAGRLTLYRNCILWLLWGLKPEPMEWSYVAKLAAISLALVILHISSRREEAKRTAKKTERENVLLLAADGVIIVEKGGKAVRCNATALEMMKVGSEAELLATLKTYTSEGSILSRATSDSPNPFYTSHSGRSFEWRFLTSPERTFLFIHDSAPLRSLKTSIVASNSFTKALLADFLKRLRIPANTIVNLTEEVGESGGFAMKACKSAAHTLASVMSDLRDNEQMRSGIFELKKTKFELDKLLSECVHIMTPQAALKRVTIAQRYDRTIPSMIHSDWSRVRQVTLTLLNDAIKFNSSGYLELVAISTRDNTVKISIEDTDSRSKDLGEYIDIRLAVAKNISKHLSSSGLRVEDSSVEGFKSSFEIDISHRNDGENDSGDETDESINSDDSVERFAPEVMTNCRRSMDVGQEWQLDDVTAYNNVSFPRKPERQRRVTRYMRLLSF